VPTRTYRLAFALIAAVAFLLLARQVMAGASLPSDLAIRDAVHAWASPLATRVWFEITMLGSEWVMIPLAAVVLMWRGRRGVRFVITALAAELASNLLKLAFHRPRPDVFFEFPPAETYSFPSGHAFVGTVYYGMLAGVLIGAFPAHRRSLTFAAAAIALLIGCSRVYLGYHYPSDVLGGWLCAAVTLALACPPAAPGKPRRSPPDGRPER
jgi:undecaprenyl-diphosphatase